MEFQAVVGARRMVRSYLHRPVDPSSIERIVNAGLMAPSAGNAQGVRLAVVLAQEMRRRLAGAAGEAAWVAKGHPPWLGSAPVHLALGVRVDDYVERYDADDKRTAAPVEAWSVPYWWFDAGAALEAMLLAAVDEGLAAGFLGAHSIPGLAGLLGWSDVQPAGIVTIGHDAGAAPVGSAVTRPRRGGRVEWYRE